jgi:putative DNA primase/helicase
MAPSRRTGNVVTISIAAAISNGGFSPGSRQRAGVGNVIILSMEDRAEDTIVPRLKACSTNLDNVHILTTVADDDGERQFSLERDIPKLQRAIEELGSVDLIIIDPITAYLGKSDANSSGDVSRITTELTTLAQAYGACILMVSHLNKKADLQASHRVLGSVSWVGAARTILVIDKDGEDSERRTMAPAKNNLALDTTAFAFMVQPVEQAGGIKTSKVVWESASHSNTADRVLIEKGDGGVALQEAREYCREVLKMAGLKPSKLTGVPSKTRSVKLRLSAPNVTWVLVASGMKLEIGTGSISRPHDPRTEVKAWGKELTPRPAPGGSAGLAPL